MSDTVLLEREKELQTLDTALASVAKGANSSPQIIFISGVTGSGRSSLLHYACTNAGEQFHLIKLKGAQASTTDLYNNLCPNDKADYYPAFGEYRRLIALETKLKERLERAQLALGLPDLTAENPFEESLRSVQALPPQALHYLIRKIYTTYNLSQLSEQAAAFVKTGLEHLIQLNANNLNQLRAFVDDFQKECTAEEFEFYLRPEINLAKALGVGVAQISTDKPLLILIDDYSNMDDRLFGQIVAHSGNKTLWLFAVKEMPVWVNNIPNAVTLSLNLLSIGAIAALYEQKAGLEPTEQELKWLEKNTKGLPLHVHLILELLAGGSGIVDIETAALRVANPLNGLFLYFLEESGLFNDEEKSRWYMFGFLRNPDHDFMIRYANAVKDNEYPFDPALTRSLFETYQWAFEPDTNAEVLPQLHPAFREILQKHLLVERLRFSPLVEEGIIEPARNVATVRLSERESEFVSEVNTGTLRYRALDPLWNEYVRDVTYYRLWLDEGVGFLFMMPRMMFNLAYNPAQARQLLNLVETLSSSFHNEGTEFMPHIRALLSDSFASTSASIRQEEKLKALETLESLSFSERGRWFRNENLGKAPTGKGSAEAEIRAMIRLLQGKAHEETAQYDRAISLYESSLATNIGEMPELKEATGRAALYLATRSRLRGANQAALDGFLRGVELFPQEIGFRLLLWQAIRLNRPDAVLKAVNGLLDYNEPLADLYAVWALWLMGRLPEALTEARTFAANSGFTQAVELLYTLNKLAKIEELPPGFDDVIAALQG
jgi:hypothetical protein